MIGIGFELGSVFVFELDSGSGTRKGTATLIGGLVLAAKQGEGGDAHRFGRLAWPKSETLSLDAGLSLSGGPEAKGEKEAGLQWGMRPSRSGLQPREGWPSWRPGQKSRERKISFSFCFLRFPNTFSNRL